MTTANHVYFQQGKALSTALPLRIQLFTLFQKSLPLREV